MGTSFIYGQDYLNEDFEGSFLPTGWVNEAGSTDVGGNNWLVSTSGLANPETTDSNSGTQAAFFNDYAGVNDRWLVSPVIDLSSATLPVLTYFEMTQYTFYATIGVYYSTDYTPGNAATATWTPINVPVDKGADAQDIWTIRGNFDLSSLNGNSSVYIGFNYIGNGDSEWYVDDVLVREVPACIEPATGTLSNITTTSADFVWTSGPGGTETLWDVELVDITGGESHDVDGTITSTGSNPFSFTSLTPGNSYTVYVRADCGGSGKSLWTGPFAFSASGNNDNCATAEVMVQEILGDSVNTVNGTISGATDSGIAENCFGGDPNDDVWYSFVARTDGVNITVDTPFDGVVELFSTTDDTCGTLSASSIACADGEFGGTPEVLAQTGMVAGDTYFVRVYQYETAAPADGSFTIRIWSSETLSNNDVEDLAEFKFYPNPVQNKLNLRAQDNIQKISVYNMLGQEVLRQAPNNNTTQVDMSALQTGSYFVKVTINGVTETKQIIKR